MNAAANWLFTFLLGWTGKLFNGGLKYISNNAAGLHSIFAVIWLPLLLILLCIGTALDFGVWFVRWRPQDLWRSEAHRKLIVKKSKFNKLIPTKQISRRAWINLPYGLLKKSPLCRNSSKLFPQL